MQKLVTRFLNDESGATAIEYGLIAALIGVAIITGANSIGTNLDEKFNAIADAVGNDASIGNANPT